MEYLYPMLISFILVFISELGDKTQILVLSFSSKLKTLTILIGVALGSFFSHGIAILFGSFLGNIENPLIHNCLEVLTYSSFIIFGLLAFKKTNPSNSNKDNSEISKLSQYKLNYILIIAFSIIVGELGDKTFLSSIGLGIEYSSYKISLIIGAILGMIASDSIAIIFGKMLSKKLPESLIQKFSGTLFLIFGGIGFFRIFM